MTKSDLEKWRFSVPFLVASAAALPIVALLFKDPVAEAKVIKFAVLPACWLAAYLYSAMKLRNTHWFRELNAHVTEQIRTELIKLVPSDLEVTQEEKKELREKEIWKKLTGVFWEAVDSDSDLIRHKEHFYANGVFYTTAIDLYIVLTCAAIIYLGLCWYLQDFRFFVGAFISLVVALLSRFLVLPSCRKWHLELSSEQLDLLKRKKRDFVRDRFREIVVEWRKERQT
jgi:hypothetical protein